MYVYMYIRGPNRWLRVVVGGGRGVGGVLHGGNRSVIDPAHHLLGLHGGLSAVTVHRRVAFITRQGFSTLVPCVCYS